jgi:cytochrome c peroxidase
VDEDGHELTYELSIFDSPPGFDVQGARVSGAFNTVGYLKASIRATDPYGGVATNAFALVVPHSYTARPNLPATSFVYEDAKLPIPEPMTKMSSNSTVNRPTDAGATLGRVLFYDKRLSVTNTHSCGSCHEQAKGFTNGARSAAGALGHVSARSPMSLINVRFTFNEKFFSDQRVQGLEKLVLMPIEDPTELAASHALVIEKLTATDFYAPLFTAAFGSSDVTSERISIALGQFLRSIVSYQAKYDGIWTATIDNLPIFLSPQEIEGHRLFQDGRCFDCHDGISTMSEAANNGIDATSAAEEGAGLGKFRAGSFRNIAITAPYMHDGRFATLRDVIEFYDTGIHDNPQLHWKLHDVHQPRRLNLSAEEKLAMEAFLNTLTDTSLIDDPKFSDPFE